MAQHGNLPEDPFDVARYVVTAEIASLLEQICLCSLADDDAGVVRYSALLRDVLTKPSPTRD